MPVKGQRQSIFLICDAVGSIFDPLSLQARITRYTLNLVDPEREKHGEEMAIQTLQAIDIQRIAMRNSKDR